MSTSKSNNSNLNLEEVQEEDLDRDDEDVPPPDESDFAPESAKRVTKSKDEWKAQLTEKEYDVLINKGTEMGGSGIYNKHYPSKGYYECKGCKLPLYSFQSKFDSGCGWPAYDACYHSKVMDGCHINFIEDNSFGMQRTEIVCKRCNGHLGHVFYGEQSAESERHCVNSVSVKYVKGNEPKWCITGPLKGINVIM